MRNPFRQQPWIVREAQDRFRLHFPEALPSVLAELGGELHDLLTTDADVVRRVFPVAYADDDEREAGYQAMVRGQLIERHQAGLDLIAQTATADELNAEELSRWMTTVNAVRLILGTALDVDEETDLELDEDDPQFPVERLYLLLGFLLEQILAAFGDPPTTDTRDHPSPPGL